MELGIKCVICDLLCDDINAYLQHVKIHRNFKVFQCPVTTCSVKFRSFPAFRKHLKQQHSAGRVPLFSKCLVLGCDFEENDVNKTVKHAMNHISAGQPVYCPFGCPTRKPFATENSLRIHRMYVHRKQTPKLSPPTQKHGAADASCKEVNCEELGEFAEVNCLEDCEKTLRSESPRIAAEILLGSLFLKLFSKHHVTDTAIQEIVEALSEIGNYQAKMLRGQCEDIFNQFGLGEEHKLFFVEPIVNSLIFQNTFGTNGIFRSSHMRKKFFSTNFAYVCPVEVPLQKNNDHNECFYYYVPILDTLKALLCDPHIYEAAFREKHCVPGYLYDFTDGLKFKSSSFFTKKTVNIFIYQDAAEVVLNPIGNATSKYKMICVYLVIGNLDPHLRVLTDNVHLILLCKNKDFAYFGPGVIFRRLIEDLKTLEDEGIVIHGGGFEETVYGSVFTTLNDNLGAHQLAGMTENFSRCSYFCRSCYIDHDTFLKDPLHISDRRTPEENVADLEVIAANPSKVPYRGVKSTCIFNELRYFNVFDFGAAPCMAHDLFEGWVNADLFLIFKKMISSRVISLNYLQGRVKSIFKTLKISTQIIFNFTRKAKTIKGKACDIWHLIQILPFILMDKPLDINNPLYTMLLLITKITSIITSPIISETQVRILAYDLKEYMELREEHFDVPLRPKHHFTLHYPKFILWMGPPMIYCTLFCERKHCFFKRCLRTTINFKNVLKFCSEQHQYFQGLLNQQNLRFKNDIILEKFVENFSDLPSNIQSLLDGFGIESEQNVYIEKGSYLGYTYCRGDFLFLEHDQPGEQFLLLEIELLVFNKNNGTITIFGEQRIVQDIHERGLKEVVIDNSIEKKYITRSIHDFIDRAPIARFEENGKIYLFTKHAVPSFE